MQDVALFTQEGLVMILRWVHFFAGVAWIGHLYYFNFVQAPFFAEIDAPTKNTAFVKLVPKALWWFRYGALYTFLSGIIMLAIAGHDYKSDFFLTSYGVYIYTGALLGTLMFLNVWTIIWPKQQILIANAEAVLAGKPANPEAAKVAPQALLASRTNVLFSIPMLFFMGASRHLGLTMAENFNALIPLAVVTVIILALEANAIWGKIGILAKPTGVIHSGLGLLVLLYGLLEFLC
jgi:uncharacterized membrane protein